MVSPIHAAALVGSVLGAGVVIAWRMREARTPVTIPKLVMPPLGMATGFAMFLYPPTHVPLGWALLALGLGASVLALPLVHTSRLTISDGHVFVRRSAAFLWVLLALVAVRMGARAWIEQYVSLYQSGALFYLLAFGMVARWRVGMLLEYRRLQARLGS